MIPILFENTPHAWTGARTTLNAAMDALQSGGETKVNSASLSAPRQLAPATNQKLRACGAQRHATAREARVVVKGLRDESGRRLVALLWLLPRRWSPHLERIAGAGPEATWRGGGPFPPCCCATLSLRAEERSVGAVGGAAPPPCPRNILAAVVGHRCGPALANRPEELHVALRIRTVHLMKIKRRARAHWWARGRAR